MTAAKLTTASFGTTTMQPKVFGKSNWIRFSLILMTVGVGGCSSGPLLFVNVHWALVLVGALRILRLLRLRFSDWCEVSHSCSVHWVIGIMCGALCFRSHDFARHLDKRWLSCFYRLRTIYRSCISLSSGFRCYYGAVAIEVWRVQWVRYDWHNRTTDIYLSDY